MNFEVFIEQNYFHLLKMSCRLENLPRKEKFEYQKFKFEFISDLFSKLFKYKNSKTVYTNISSLIILSLTAFSNEFPIDIYSGFEEKNINEVSSEFKKILKQEFVPQIPLAACPNIKNIKNTSTINQ